MESDRSVRNAGWYAYAAGVAFILAIVFIALFFAVGQPWGSLNDLSFAIWAILQIPVALALDRRFRAKSSALNRLAVGIAVLGFLLLAVSSVLIILHALGIVQFFQFQPGTGPYGAGFVAFVLAGLWLVLVGLLSRRSGALPATSAWLAILAGIGNIVSIVLFALIGLSAPPVVFAVGGIAYLLVLIAYPVWIFWVGRILLGARAAAD